MLALAHLQLMNDGAGLGVCCLPSVCIHFFTTVYSTVFFFFRKRRKVDFLE